MESKLVVKNGRKVIHVFYGAEDADKAIERARKKYGLNANQASVLAYPKRRKR